MENIQPIQQCLINKIKKLGYDNYKINSKYDDNSYLHIINQSKLYINYKAELIGNDKKLDVMLRIYKATKESCERYIKILNRLNNTRKPEKQIGPIIYCYCMIPDPDDLNKQLLFIILENYVTINSLINSNEISNVNKGIIVKRIINILCIQFFKYKYVTKNVFLNQFGFNPNLYQENQDPNIFCNNIKKIDITDNEQPLDSKFNKNYAKQLFAFNLIELCIIMHKATNGSFEAVKEIYENDILWDFLEELEELEVILSGQNEDDIIAREICANVMDFQGYIERKSKKTTTKYHLIERTNYTLKNGRGIDIDEIASRIQTFLINNINQNRSKINHLGTILEIHLGPLGFLGLLGGTLVTAYAAKKVYDYVEKKKKMLYDNFMNSLNSPKKNSHRSTKRSYRSTKRSYRKSSKRSRRRTHQRHN
jgi:hypothetical protein